MEEKKFDLEDRLVDFSCRVIEVVEALPSTRAGNYIAGQLIRCGLAPSLLYGEAQSAESRMDFVHKMKINLKELKETRVCLKIITKSVMIKPVERLNNIKSENEQLVSIIAKSIDTAKKNIELNKKKPPDKI
ncbi:MAG: four helix bundle protein [Bacteroidota bacterium]|nr:four helix bundle protein [Bacteroidota bacterium]